MESIHACIAVAFEHSVLCVREMYALENMMFFILQSMGRTNHKFPVIRNTQCSNATEFNCMTSFILNFCRAKQDNRRMGAG